MRPGHQKNLKIEGQETSVNRVEINVQTLICGSGAVRLLTVAAADGVFEVHVSKKQVR